MTVNNQTDAYIKALLVVKKSIEHNSDINTLLVQVINANSSDKALNKDKLLESIKKINRQYARSIDEIITGIQVPDTIDEPETEAVEGEIINQ